MKRKFAAVLFKNRFQSKANVRQILENEAAAERQRMSRMRSKQQNNHGHIRGVYNGQFFRLKIPGPSLPSFFALPKLRDCASPMMRPFVKTEVHHHQSESSSVKAVVSAEQALEHFWERARQWLKCNWGVLMLNFGSICSLLAFTRSDVLELRSLAVSGSLSSLVYFATLPPEQRSWTPIVWSILFVTVNGTMIRDILEERQPVVHFRNKKQEDIYRSYFAHHGVTPKQFKYIMKRARIVRLNDGDILVREGAPMKRVFLVMQGKTRAHHLGRRLTAVSFGPATPEYQASYQGGSSGAWVGEMAFLERFWGKEKNQTPEFQSTYKDRVEDALERPSTKPGRLAHHHPTARAMYTISAVQDGTIVLAWQHADMEALLKKSSDLKTALSRAMTASIVAKVVAFTASKKAVSAAESKSPSWLERWRTPLKARPQSHKKVPPITWIEEEEDEPKKVKIDRKPTFLLPESER